MNWTTGQELEVQSYINAGDGDPNEIPNFLYRPQQSHVLNTDFAPGAANDNPVNYNSTTIEFGTVDDGDVWDTLVKINAAFLISIPNFAYGLLQQA